MRFHLRRAGELLRSVDASEAVSQEVAEHRIFLAHESCLSQAALRRIAELRVLHSVSGPFDLIAVVAAASMVELDELIDRIGQLDGVERTTSAIVLSTRIER